MAPQGSKAASLDRFETIRQQTECVFARGTRLWGAEDWVTGAVEVNLDRFHSRMTEFASVADEQELDGMVLEVAEPDAGSTIEQVASTTRMVIEGLIARDPGASPSPPVEDPAWWPIVAGVPLFVASFAPCYDRTSSRYAFGLDRTYLLFQTRGSFIRRWSVHSASLSEAGRRRTREAFQAAGRPYDLEITLSPLEAHRYVKPARLGDPPVEWWNSRAGER